MTPTNDRQTLLEMYEADELDSLQLFRFGPAGMVRARARHPKDFTKQQLQWVALLMLDTTRPPLDNLLVRRALAMATDREATASVILSGFATPATGGLVPPGMAGHSPGIGLPFDPAQARHLLAQAGYPGGRSLCLQARAWVHPLLRVVTDFLQAEWRRHLGVEASWTTDGPDRPHLRTMSWVADYPDPHEFLGLSEWPHWSGWRHAGFAELATMAGRTLDQQERMKLYRQADAILVREASIIPLFYLDDPVLVKPWVSGFTMSAMGEWDAKDIIIEPH
jgi:oligopeptide transport system substrate-binding protein